MYKCSNFHRLISDGVVFAIDIEAQLHQFSRFFKTLSFSWGFFFFLSMTLLTTVDAATFIESNDSISHSFTITVNF